METVSIIPEGTVVFGIQLPIQSQSTIYCEDWEPSSGPAEMARIARAGRRERLLLHRRLRSHLHPAGGWPRP